MGKFTTVIGGLCLGLALAGVAAQAAPLNLLKATPGYVYFNRVGATKAVYEAELADCLSIAVSTFRSGNLSRDGRFSAAINPIYSGIVPGLMADLQFQARGQTNLENCMVVMGWRVVRIDDSRGAALWHADAAAVGQQVEAWIGMANPPGEIVRVFSNDAAHRDNVTTGIPAPFGQASLHSLAMRAFDPKSLKSLPEPKPFHYAGWGSKILSRPLDAGKLDAVPDGMATVVLTIVGDVRKCNGCLGFQRVGPTEDVLASEADGQPDLFYFDKRSTFVSGNENLDVIALPPGKWRVTNRGNLEMCLGAPSFEVKAGEVLYLGRFDIIAETLAPDMAMDQVKARLAITPGLAAALRPATWTNGATWPCHTLFLIYAMEFEGHPFEPGYRAGGASGFRPAAAH